MSQFAEVLALVAGVVIRLAIPVILTILVVQLLRIWDARWQREAESAPLLIEKPACWEVKKCAPECRESCPGYTSPLPCWQARRMDNGYLREECLGCKVFLQAPVPSLG